MNIGVQIDYFRLFIDNIYQNLMTFIFIIDINQLFHSVIITIIDPEEEKKHATMVARVVYMCSFIKSVQQCLKE